MIKQIDRMLAEELVKRGLFSQTVAEKYLNEAQSSNESLKSFLLNRHLASEKEILEALSSLFQLPLINLKSMSIEKSVIDRVPVRFAWFYKFMPIKIENRTILLASSSPLDVKYQDEIRVHLGLEPKIVLARETDVFDALNKYYGLAADTIERLVKEIPKDAAAEPIYSSKVEELEKETDEASISKLVNQILLEAYKKRATDIHIEPYRNKVRVRYRIDGVLVDANIPAAVRQFLLSIISRIKIIANLSIVERRLPQDGSAVVNTKEQDLDLRISTIPTPHGESMVIRILPTKVMFFSLEKLGLEKKNVNLFRQLIKKPHGIILVTGPTGSGKTTTLYACLNELNSADRKMITLEDPIEYELEGITQIQINPKVEFDFARGLRSVLRHDPDIIMVGEIRDLETAEIAIRTALTGHLVFSTLHTNDAASGITRLVDMGVEPFLVASSIEAFVAQRLVRVICPQCKEEVKTPMLEVREEIAQALKMEKKDPVKIYSGRGCDQCNQTGFYGRTAIYEILVIDEEIRTAILEKRRADSIKQLAMRHGMMTLRQDGWRKVLDGLTTPMEVMNATEKDEYSKREEEVPVVAAQEIPPIDNRQVFSRKINPETLVVKNEYDSRVYPRIKEKLGIRYAIVKQDPKDPTQLIVDKVEHSSLTKDLSAGGVRFVSGYPLAVGTILDLKIHLERNERSIDCLAKICRVEDDNLSSMYNLVAYYLDISSSDRAKIEQFIKIRSAQTGQQVEIP